MLTYQERRLLLGLCFVLAAGSLSRFAFVRYPAWHRAMHLMDSDRLYLKVDVNRADSRRLQEVPYIGERTAALIIAHRREKGPFRSLDELRRLPGVPARNFERFAPYLLIRGQRPGERR